jgi:hypothetical protein
MTTNRPDARPTGPDVPSVAEAAGGLATAVDELAAADRSIRRAVLALTRTVGTDVCETVEGLTPDLLLANLCRLIQADRSTVLTAADVLRSMPHVCGLWEAGALSWGQVRNIALKASRLSLAEREALDRRLAASDDLDAYGPDGLLDAVDRAIADVRATREVGLQERHQDRDDFLWTQASFDGGLKLYGELSGVRAATVAKALQDAAPAITPHATRAERLAVGLGRVCGGWLAGGSGRKAKPLVDVLVDLTQVTVNAAGTVELHVKGALTTLTARSVEALVEDAGLHVTLFDGKRPLASSKLRRAPAIPTVIRRVASLRDRGDRMPGSRGKGGDHHPDNVLRLRPRWHHSSTTTAGGTPSTPDRHLRHRTPRPPVPVAPGGHPARPGPRPRPAG